METNINSITGTWQNQAPYNSLLKIETYIPLSGQISGVYESSTGASGTYNFIGYVNKSPTGNMSICLAIDWKSIKGGAPDNSWHWGSIYAGVYAVDATNELGDAEERIEVLNCLTASIPFPGLVENPGTYSETLIFKKVIPPNETVKSSPVKDSLKNVLKADNPLIGSWSNTNANSLIQSLSISSNSMIATWLDGRETAIIGHSDPDYIKADFMSISFLSTPKEGNDFLLGLSANFDYKNNSGVIVFVTTKSYPASWKAKYFSVALGSDTFIKS